jgi:hypothetical protein
MSQGVDRDAGEGVQIALAVDVPKPCAIKCDMASFPVLLFL